MSYYYYIILNNNVFLMSGPVLIIINVVLAVRLLLRTAVSRFDVKYTAVAAAAVVRGPSTVSQCGNVRLAP